MELVLIFIAIELAVVMNGAEVYKEASDAEKINLKIISVEEAPSRINCANRCNIKKADFTYKDDKCTCVVYSEDAEDTASSPTLTGTFYKLEEDRCVSANGGCDPNAKCSNTAGSNTCTCNEGYSGNGITCADIDECIAAANPCPADATCTNNIGSYTCKCNSGYTGDGKTCTPQCPMLNIEMHGGYVTEFDEVKSWQDCGEKCMTIPGCARWKWRGPSFFHSSYREKCYIMSSDASSPRVTDGVVSGPRGCVA